MKRNILLIAGLFAGLLAACGSEPTAQLPVETSVEETASEAIAPEETAVDEQGAVSVAAEEEPANESTSLEQEAVPVTAIDEQADVSAAVEEEAADDESTAPEQTVDWDTAVDEQGAVSVAVTPLDLSREASTLAFEVAMNTHSVDLSMDLAKLATLTTDDGRTVSATLWDAVPGGHHVSGMLMFPAIMEGTAVLEGATELTLTITNIDAPSRTFTWRLSQ